MIQPISAADIDDARERRHQRKIAGDFISSANGTPGVELLTELLMFAHFRGQQFALHRASMEMTRLAFIAGKEPTDHPHQRKGDKT